MLKKIFISLSVMMNVVVIASVVYFSTGGAASFFRKNFIQPGHERWVSQFEIFPVKAGETVFLGDSITEFGAWDELFPNTNVRNRGIGGDVTMGVLARLAQVTRGKPEQVFLLIGTNDLAFGVKESQIIANIKEIVERIDIESPGTHVYVQSILPRGADYRERVESLNQKLEAALKDEATWVNIYPHLLNQQDGSIANQFSNDELHLMGDGYLVWREQIIDLVNKIEGRNTGDTDKI